LSKAKSGKEQPVENDKDIKIHDMPKTIEFLAFSHITQAVFGALFKAIFSGQATLAYIMMVLSMVFNAGFISILYPLGVFGYALMEEGRPGKWFWKIMLNYTLTILFIKFLVQLQFWQSFNTLAVSFVEIDDWLISGVRSKDTLGALMLYILPEMLVLGFIIGQTYYEQFTCLYEKREIFLEDISQAKQRFLTAIKDVELAKI
jgi:hypothetical protein